ncbi:MAG: hypothetical protein ACOC5T_05750 [Elusimicrobiota bacterium]
MNNIKKPWGITLNVIMFAIAGISAFLASVGILSDQSVVAEIFPITVFVQQIAVLTLILSVLYIVFSIYLWHLDDFAWWSVVTLNTVGIVLALFSIAVSPLGLIVLALQIVMLASLFHKETIAAVNPAGIDYPGWELE